jgi:uncharacterized protein YqeY
MPTKAEIFSQIAAAMKRGDRERLGVLRLIKARLLEAEVQLRAERGRDAEIDEEAVITVLASLAKQRRESIEAFRGGGRPDLVTAEERELTILQEFLPAPLTEDEIREQVRRAIAQCGAGSIRDTGKVMQILMPLVKGRADGRLVGLLVREALESRGGAP